MQAEIGLIGLGVMGANLALNIVEKGFVIAVYNRTWATTEKFVADAGPLAARIIACRTMADLDAATARRAAAAVAARVLSLMKDERTRAEKLYKISRKKLSPKSKAAFTTQLESALYAAKIAAYA